MHDTFWQHIPKTKPKNGQIGPLSAQKFNLFAVSIVRRVV